MMRSSGALTGVACGILVLVAGAPLAAQDFSPPPSRPPDAAALKAIAAKTARLEKVLAALRKQGLRDPQLAELQVFLTAAQRVVRHNEFFQAESPAWTDEALDRGLLRARFAAQGESPWLHGRGFAVVRAYRSKIDGSVQPYAVTLPATYGNDPNRKWRLDVVLHGRDPGLTEVMFLRQHNGDQAAPRDQPFVRLDVFGRGNNAYRWAGEADVFEALESFLTVERGLARDKLLDLSRVVLRGFSMGGAGTWHLGLHYPDRWCLLGPGAGFTTTHGYVKGLPAQIPPWQEKCLRIYDALDYADNLFDVPAVAYAGADDPQRQAALNIEGRLKSAQFPYALKVLTAPGLEHAFPPAWQAKAEAAYAPFVAKGRPEYPPRVRFVTCTLRFPGCDWVEILALDRHYERALVDAERAEGGFTVRTANVRALHLSLPVGAAPDVKVTIDGQAVQARAWPGGEAGTFHVYLQRRGKEWAAVLPQFLLTQAARHPRKAIRLQGPIDDAFMGSFLCVRGTEPAWHEAVKKYADADLERFQHEWARYWRGELPVKDDVDVSNEDIATKHLVLFGDPASNSLIAQVLAGLPLRWTKESVTLGGKAYAAADHVPALIYPSPLNGERYVVLNSGHTFHAADYRGTNALLYPRLGDYAVLRLKGGNDPLAVEVATAGLFNDSWQLGEE
jgi:pimeloyl-ACP methyl ester carboxylesterase